MNKICPIYTFPHINLDRLAFFAQRLLARLPAGTTIALVGTLGAGKTRLVQSIAAAVGIDTSQVTSPTFTLVQTHVSNPTIHHLDAYRVADEDEFLELGVEELFDDSAAITIVEWADLVRNVMPNEAVWIDIRIESDEERVLSVICRDEALSNRIRLVHEDCFAEGWDLSEGSNS